MNNEYKRRNVRPEQYKIHNHKKYTQYTCNQRWTSETEEHKTMGNCGGKGKENDVDGFFYLEENNAEYTAGMQTTLTHICKQIQTLFEQFSQSAHLIC